MLKVLIADDEAIILEGLKSIIDWNALGFQIVSQASNGQDALDKIQLLQPDLVLLDIRMPKLNGTEIVQIARENGYNGHFIFLSGYSDFSYAQTAIRYGVNYYLTKPVEETELINAVQDVKNLIQQEQQQKSALLHYKSKAKDSIIKDILTGECNFMALDLDELNLNASVYQVVIYERYTQDSFPTWYNFAELLRITNQDSASFDYIVIDNINIILLKGSFSLQRFQALLEHYKTDIQKGSPLDSTFLAYGRTVYKLENIHLSYEEARQLLRRRFFCEKNQHILNFSQLPDDNDLTYSIASEDARNYHKLFIDYLQVRNRKKLAKALHDLEQKLFYAKENTTEIKHYLADIYIQIKNSISNTYNSVSIPFPPNSSVIELIESKFFLYEILLFFSEQFEIIMKATSTTTGDHVLDDMLYYIELNYMENLKLENIAHLFGYNSSYLGKIFSTKVGINFNAYVDQIRIRHAKELLRNKELKVYEVSKQIGYKNVDYFHKKFKKQVGKSPAEYRRSLEEEEMGLW